MIFFCKRAVLIGESVRLDNPMHKVERNVVHAGSSTIYEFGAKNNIAQYANILCDITMSKQRYQNYTYFRKYIEASLEYIEYSVRGRALKSHFISY